MTVCYLDAFSGISGDMLVGALCDAGADSKSLIAGLDSLNTGARLSFEKVKRCKIAATKFQVVVQDQKSHRPLSGILRMISSANLPEAVKVAASKVFERLGEAEARVHGVPMEKVHFHEVGAVDSICDIVGACLGLDMLGVNELHSSAINVGGGTAETEHGTLPVPAPATASLLLGKPLYSRGPAVELTTPTGAAIAATLGTRFGPMPAMSAIRIGYGAGTKDFKEHANVLRVIVGESTSDAEARSVAVIEANIDDSSPQILGYAMERLLAAGALDATLQSLEMKKSRPGSLLQVISRVEDQEAMAQIIFAETSTIGIRMHIAERRVLPRTWIEVETKFGKVRMKVAGEYNFQPEYEDCRRLALQAGVPLKQIMAAAVQAYLNARR